MNLNLDKFWQFIKEWSVGRMVILLSFIFLIFNPEYCFSNFYFDIIIISIFFEIFELCNNKFAKEPKTKRSKTEIEDVGRFKKSEEQEFQIDELTGKMKFGLYFIMLLSLVMIGLIAYNLLQDFNLKLTYLNIHLSLL